MVAEVIAIGSEMLFADRIDSNSLYTSAQLERFGISLIAKTVVGDDLTMIRKALALALTRADFIFLTGGLGPTEDDLTRQAVSEQLGLELVYHPEIVRQIESRFQSLGRSMPEINRRQGFILETAQALENSEGTAPGQYVQFEGRNIFLLPGPPRELQPMFQKYVIPLIEQLGLRPRSFRYFRIAGLPESRVDSLVAPIYRQYPDIQSTILASPGDIELFFFAENDARLAELAEKVTAELGDNIYATEEISLEAAIARLIKERGVTLSVAESCTGGMVGEWITRTPGSSEFFLGGVVAYSNSLKIDLLGVPPEMLRDQGAVSEEAAKAMADGARRRTGSSYALSITGVAGPGGGSESKPVGTVFIGCSHAGRTIAARFQFPGNREVVRLLSTRAALNLLRKELQMTNVEVRMTNEE
ncbi:MAG TPA: competence/damage-inducible protein A [Acidobacteriota bacterium]|jgi:nicotinamide-nucleotide amidase|nr:competence/damage-inducible protein A [Acidobacteriota bacterium]